jgi:dihydrofolate reductase
LATGHVFLAISVDGFVARKDHALDWLDAANQAGEDMGAEAFFARMDAIVMGRGSFETLLGFDDWPYAFPAVVLSRTMAEDDIPQALRGKVRLSRQTPEDVMAELTAQGCARVYVDGGRLVHSFIRAGLIADMTLTTIPVLLGEGLSLFGPLGGDIALTVTRSQAFASGAVQTSYTFAAP